MCLLSPRVGILEHFFAFATKKRGINMAKPFANAIPVPASTWGGTEFAYERSELATFFWGYKRT